MRQPFSRHFWYSWQLALLLSVLVHAGFAALIWFLTFQTGSGGNNAGGMLDTRVQVPEVEVSLVVCEPQRHKDDVAPRVMVGQARLWEGEAPPQRPEEKPPVHEEPGASAGHGQVANQGHAGTGTGTSSATTTFFEIPADGQSVVYVIDRSMSMGLNNSLSAAIKELVKSLERLPPTARFQVVIYNRTPEPLLINGRTEPVSANAKNKRAVAAILQTLFAEGSTEHLPALKLALLWQPDVIYFLTDAADLTAEQIRAVTLFNRGRSTIHAVQIGSAPRLDQQSPLQLLASQNRGVYRSIVLGQ